MSRTGKRLAPTILGLGILLAACHPTGAEYVTDLDVVATTHDATFDFATPTTYTRPDRIVLIEGDTNPGGNPDYLPADLTQLILSTFDNEMSAIGYQKVAITASPNLAVSIAALKVTNVSYYYGYWCGYWGWYYPCYPYYPPVVGVSTYVVGSLIIDLGPYAATPPDNTAYRGAWTAVIRGIQTGNNNTDRTRIVNGISQAFIQSPYLGKP